MARIFGEQPETSAALKKLLEMAAVRPMTAAERWDQRVSWAYGNLPHDSTTTKEQVIEMMTKLYGPRPSDHA